MRSQLWYFGGSQAKMIDTGLDEVEAINDTADTIIYRVSGRLGEKNADLSEIEDVDRFLNQVAEDSERGYRLVNRGVCSTLAPAGYISEVQFAEKGTHLGNDCARGAQPGSGEGRTGVPRAAVGGDQGNLDAHGGGRADGVGHLEIGRAHV